MVVKNYQELCGLLNISPKSGNTKIAQMNNFKNYFNFRREGNKIIIGKIYDVPKFSGVAKNSLISRECDCILLMLLMKNENTYLSVPMSSLANLLGFCNENYQLVQKVDTPIYQALKKKYEDEFYQGKHEFLHMSRRSFTDTIVKTLNRLRAKHYIDYIITHYGCTYENENISKQLKKEMKENPNFNFKSFVARHQGEPLVHFPLKPELDNTRGRILLDLIKEYECEDLQEIFKIRRIDEFFEEYGKRLFEKLGIIRAYRVFNIKAYKTDIGLDFKTLRNYTEALNCQFYNRLSKRRERKQEKSFAEIPTNKIFKDLLDVAIKIKKSDLTNYEDKIKEILSFYSKSHSSYPQPVGIEPMVTTGDELDCEYYYDYLI